MNWNKFNTFGESKEKAFEIFSNQIFKAYCKEKYADSMKKFVAINGNGGDGGIEAYAELDNGQIIAIQSKAFFDAINTSRINQIRESIKTAIKVRQNIEKYVVSVPRNLADKKSETTKSERQRIEDLFLEFKDKNIEFELWGEFELFDFISKSADLSGIMKFWFDNTEIIFSTIKQQFELQKNGWLKGRYNENLHVKSSINTEINRLMGDIEYKQEEIEEAYKIKSVCKDYLTMVKKYADVVKENKKEEYQIICDEQEKIINELDNYLDSIIEYLKNENIKLKIEKRSFLIDTEWFYRLEKKHMSMYQIRLKENVENVESIDIDKYLRKIEYEYNRNNLIIMGDLGTGKTHAVVNQIQNELKRDNIAILVRASDINDKSSWKEILVKSLGLSDTWSEDEIFSALEMLADRNWYLKEQDSEILINNKVLICFDGIDEHSNYQYWYEKQLEADQLSQKYKKIRFCFIGRKYAYKNIKKLENYRFLYYDSNQGYDMEEMYKKYISEYNIRVINSINVKAYLNNPLVLKSFSEMYKNKMINTLNGLKINLAQLFKVKLEEMDKDLTEKEGIDCINPVSRAAKIIIEYLYFNDEAAKKQIIDLMDKDDELSLLDIKQKHKVINALQKYGLLQIKKTKEDPLITNEVYYKGMQPIVDYIMAVKLSNEIKCKSENIGTKKNMVNPAILKICALILLEDDGTYFQDINEICLDERIIKESTYYAVVNANPLNVGGFKSRIEKDMISSPNNMRNVLNNVIIPCARIPNHPLGTEFLNDLLCRYTDMSSRDKIWSIPDRLEYKDYRINQELILNKNNPTFFLKKEDRYNGLPLVYTWLLTGVDNHKLYFYRNQLMKWGLLCPQQFVLLLDKISNSNDLQLLEQIYGIAMCVCNKVHDENVVKEILNIINRIFYKDEKIKIYDFQIRSYIRDIAEKAFNMGLISYQKLQKYVPPYNCDKVLELNKDAAMYGNRMAGYSAIHYDLARYVLCDHIGYKFFEYPISNYEEDKINLENVFSKEELLKYKGQLKDNKEFKDALASFENNKKMSLEFLLDFEDEDKLGEFEEALIDGDKVGDSSTEELLQEEIEEKDKGNSIYSTKILEFFEKEGEKIENKNLNGDTFIISAAYQYLLNCGWTEKEFYERNKIDVEIMGKYHPTTHGSKSSVMSFVEKYIWCFRNHMMGYLADNIFIDSSGKEKYKNYFEIDHVLDPITECEQFHDGLDSIQAKFIPEDVFKNVSIHDRNELKQWVEDKSLDCDLSKWVIINDEYITLSSYYCFDSINNNIEYTMWISSGIINCDDMKYLMDNICNNQEFLSDMVNKADEFTEYTIADNSRTPFEIINFKWNEVVESCFNNISLLDNNINRYKIFKTTESAYNVHTELNEVHYKIPSRKVRNMLEIDDNEGFTYKSGNDIVSLYEKNNKYWQNHHNILVVDKKKMEEELNKNNENMLWFIRVDKESNSLWREKHKEDFDRNTILAICWFEQGNLVIKSIKE